MTRSERALLALNFSVNAPGQWARELDLLGETAESLVSNRKLALSLGFKEDRWERMAGLYGSDWPEEEMERASRFGAQVFFRGDPLFPDGLDHSDDPPVVLYVKGSWPIPGPCVSIVGTRRCSPYGSQVARALAERLALAGVLVVSGGAMGIDGSAHSGALEGQGATVAVLGTGVDVVYPRGHEQLFSSISEKRGALMSRFPMGIRGNRWHFPKRNGIIAALADHLVVVESPIKGGSMITAGLAGEMGRPVWAVPGPIVQKVSQGSNKLLFDGAQPLWDLDEFVSFVAGRDSQLSLFPPGEPPKPSPLLEEIATSGGITADGLADKLGISVPEVLATLADLEADEKIYRSGPGRWCALL
ncbi:DNA protecting protein DprA [Dethiosulfovibrio peptidovorans DSM 11002]|uniref:DNA protecting protein DprA n=1 Tax=Dethiosulfovibrio peptidovorans DSM 11002 TaxID=469381 RepID=D2Z3N9_9BACT|nr:DNA-processing protein DprA [Dethiosulfovibrio peptidovorans]EFC90345.1 DNA protecting protein DprA [Dethiosulfovibrio peptidovorans DSM 11002]